MLMMCSYAHYDMHPCKTLPAFSSPLTCACYSLCVLFFFLRFIYFIICKYNFETGGKWLCVPSIQYYIFHVILWPLFIFLFQIIFRFPDRNLKISEAVLFTHLTKATWYTNHMSPARLDTSTDRPA